MRAVNKEGEDQELSDYDTALHGPPQDVVFLDSGPAGSPKGWEQHWEVRWTVSGNSETTLVAVRDSNLPIWSATTSVPWTTENGLADNGEYIQKFTFTGLFNRTTYTFRLTSSNHDWVPALWGTPVDIEILVTSRGNPAPPS